MSSAKSQLGFDQNQRKIIIGEQQDSELGPLCHLPGTWKNTGNLEGHGWNMIALPFAAGELDYRLLMNQYDEELTFSLVDKGVPNRGIPEDQSVATLDYTQIINQIAAQDYPHSGLEGKPGLAIHHEPGLWLHMRDQLTDDLDIARLSSIPHGDAVIALGKSAHSQSGFEIPALNGLPIGVSGDIDTNPYLAPYKHFRDQPFEGLFDPTQANALLQKAIAPLLSAGKVKNTTKLEVRTTAASGSVNNIPFVTRQANAAEVHSTFWIYELTETDQNGNPKLWLQYSQTVILDFFNRKDRPGELIRWPHISINTLEKVDT
ncbi:hypothetical protein PRUB_a3884 [Pseudoalteromonas rubra]|uniref:Uncharacterized protein n=1 Tax=Pseudoalteromonas rubra TaxID=43658 RepID=A0A8T0C9I8_9GAMM|nr:heme-binding protein [Pseudoalteromonas rubra]KAF7787038.1 hypothetical protein PRUB_a3884 [Pseudoalteromonas rubra]